MRNVYDTMAVQAQSREYLSQEDYLTLERQAEHKSEYFNGEVFAMAGASRQHTLIGTNRVRELGTQLRRRDCNVYANDLRVQGQSYRIIYLPGCRCCLW